MHLFPFDMNSKIIYTQLNCIEKCGIGNHVRQLQIANERYNIIEIIIKLFEYQKIYIHVYQSINTRTNAIITLKYPIHIFIGFIIFI